MISPLETFELAVPQSGNRGFARRLMDGTLRPPERQYLERVEQIAALEAEGLKYPQIAEALNLTSQKLTSVTRTQMYRLCRKYVEDRALLQGDQHQTDRRRAERRRWDSNGGKALDFYDQAFRRHLSDDKPDKGRLYLRWKKGDFVDMDRAERAAKLFAESAGWTEPLAQTAKPKELKVGVIQQAMAAMQATDRKETVVRITTTETVEIGSRETGSMGGEA